MLVESFVIDEEFDKERYATVYENKNLQNSVAAPTAGLHFDKKLLQDIQELGVEIDYVNFLSQLISCLFCTGQSSGKF